MTQKSSAYVVIKGYQTPYPDSILFNKSEPVQVGEKYLDDPDWVDWIWCEGENENAAWVPKQFIKFSSGEWRLDKYYDAMELSIRPDRETGLFCDPVYISTIESMVGKLFGSSIQQTLVGGLHNFTFEFVRVSGAISLS